MKQRDHFKVNGHTWIRIENDVFEQLKNRWGDKWYWIATNELRRAGLGLRETDILAERERARSAHGQKRKDSVRTEEDQAETLTAD